ncbi:MAG: pantetheine-phosphate adenylyltransferase [Lachnospiraceae bacterium]|nr:pantetheine-phosphate adenylyltransferase [Lachnospiraceae bacterium]
MKRAIYPGSFDPVTLGHLDIIKRAAGLFDEVIIGILVNPGKNPWFTMEERMEMLRCTTKEIPNIEIASFEGLLVDFCRMRKIDGIIRGVRGGTDFDYELPMAQINQQLYAKTETVFLAANPAYSFISSSAVKELAVFGGDYTSMLPPEIAARMKYKENQMSKNR